VPVFEVQTMEQALAQASSDTRYITFILTAFALIALILAGAGIYAVIAYSVTQRTHEIGVRLALGARQRDVLKLILAQSSLPVFIGVGIGLVAAFSLTRLMSSLLYGVRPTDVPTYSVASLLLAAVALLASYIPARRATEVDPMAALRYE